MAASAKKSLKKSQERKPTHARKSRVRVKGPKVTERDEKYLSLLIEPIKTCAHYRPKFGQGAKEGGLTLSQFRALYGGDQFYSWIGLDNPLMYAAHKAAGGMTSVYRQVGIGCERLFRQIVKDELGLSDADVRWSYSVPLDAGKSKKLSLDGRIVLKSISDTDKRQRFQKWMKKQADLAGVAPEIFRSLKGAVFEVRQGYKSKDSKRQNADIANASSAYAQAYFPCALIFSAQIDGEVLLRYRANRWAVLTGLPSESNPLISTYDFVRDVIGYDLPAFFDRNSPAIRDEIKAVLKALLAPETT